MDNLASESSIQVCTRCVMSSEGDSTIRFDENGVCNYCTDALARKESIYHPNEIGKANLTRMINELKESGKTKKYDCLMGLSGGLDSSYLAYLGAAKWGLRIAAVHVDDGFDTEISSANIANLCDKAGVELITIRPDPEQFNDLTKAFMKAGVPNLAIPQDNVLFAALHAFAKKNGISHFLSGGNYALECILQKGNTWDAYDLVNIKDIHKKFGEKPIDKLTFLSQEQRNMDMYFHRLETVRPLNEVDYNRDRAFQELHDFCGFEYYGRKHLENYLTAFIQLCWFPRKFNVDKRTSHLSSMIVSGQMTRDEALNELSEPLYEEAYMEKLMTLLCEKLDITMEEIEAYISAPGHQHDEYKTNRMFFHCQKMFQSVKKLARG